MDKEKKVDESWKEQASQEKDILAQSADEKASDDKAQADTQPAPAQESEAPVDAGPQPSEGQPAQAQDVEVNFLNYITSLGFQAMIFMGEIPNPVTNKVDKNLVQAKFLVDTLVMMKEKTSGNLNDQERDLLENSIYELQMRYVQISKDESASQESKGA